MAIHGAILSGRLAPVARAAPTGPIGMDAKLVRGALRFVVAPSRPAANLAAHPQSARSRSVAGAVQMPAVVGKQDGDAGAGPAPGNARSATVGSLSRLTG